LCRDQLGFYGLHSNQAGEADMIRIIIADDHSIVRLGLTKILAEMANVQVVAEAPSGEVAVQLARRLQPDIVLMDIMMPGMGGLEASARILRHVDRTAVIALTGCTEAPFPAQMLKVGALGYLTKNVSTAELELAIKRVFAGKRYVCNEIAQELATYAFSDHVGNPFEVLSHRELQIMMMVAGCHKVSEISTSLHLSPKTVNSYRYRIFEKLDIASDVELALLAVKHGVVDPGPKGPLPADRLSPESETRKRA
jgi:two-component system, NarL family, invasion response regulator UvrY